MIAKLLTKHYLEFLSVKRGCKGSSEYTHVKIPHCWKLRVMAHTKQCHLFTDTSLSTALPMLAQVYMYLEGYTTSCR